MEFKRTLPVRLMSVQLMFSQKPFTLYTHIPCLYGKSHEPEIRIKSVYSSAHRVRSGMNNQGPTVFSRWPRPTFSSTQPRIQCTPRLRMCGGVPQFPHTPSRDTACSLVAIAAPCFAVHAIGL
jgi:hypothetical protein